MLMHTPVGMRALALRLLFATVLVGLGVGTLRAQEKDALQAPVAAEAALARSSEITTVAAKATQEATAFEAAAKGLSGSTTDAVSTDNVAPEDKIDPSLANGGVALAGLPGAPDKTAASSRAIAMPKGQGKVEGLGESFSMQSSTGVATFSVPIAVPPARGAVDPAFSLQYTTASGAGIAGIGWNLSVPSITRQTDRGVPRYDDRTTGGTSTYHPRQDRFFFGGGQALVPLCTVTNGACNASTAPISNGYGGSTTGERFPSWAEGWQYFRPAVEGGYQRFFWAPGGRTWQGQPSAYFVLRHSGRGARARDLHAF
jgi:Salmonella virulence plasmid 65kDa B protein